MKVIILTVLVFLSVGYSNAASASERCQQLTDFASRAISKLDEVLPEWDWALILASVNNFLGFDIKNSTTRETVLCKIAGAKNLHELNDALPREMVYAENYEYFLRDYDELQREIAGKLGGYTNIGRLVDLVKDIDEWAKQQNPGRTLHERTDLATLTDFLKVLQVKYGSRAFSFFVGEDNEGFLVKDPEELAQKLYEGDVSAIMEYTGLRSLQVVSLVRFFGGLRKASYNIFELLPLVVEGMNLVGDMGLLTLKP